MAESKIERNKLFMKVYKQLQKELVPVRPNRTYKRKRNIQVLNFHRIKSLNLDILKLMTLPI